VNVVEGALLDPIIDWDSRAHGEARRTYLLGKKRIGELDVLVGLVVDDDDRRTIQLGNERVRELDIPVVRIVRMKTVHDVAPSLE